MRKILALSVSLGLALVFASCNRNSADRMATAGPEDVVREFVSISSAAKGVGDRKTLGALCSGEMKNAFDKMTDEVFRISYLNTNLKVHDLKMLETVTQGDTARVHYQIFLDNPHGTDPTSETNEREVELVKRDGHWLIDTIRGKGSDQIAFTRGMIF